MNKPLLSNQGKLNGRLIKIKDQEKRKQKQNDEGGKAPFLAAVKPSAGAGKQSFSWTSMLAVHSKRKLWNRTFWNRLVS